MQIVIRKTQINGVKKCKIFAIKNEEEVELDYSYATSNMLTGTTDCSGSGIFYENREPVFWVNNVSFLHVIPTVPSFNSTPEQDKCWIEAVRAIKVKALEIASSKIEVSTTYEL